MTYFFLKEKVSRQDFDPLRFAYFIQSGPTATKGGAFL